MVNIALLQLPKHLPRYLGVKVKHNTSIFIHGAGIQGQLWSETVRTPRHMHHMVFPRLLALAERAWHNASWESDESDSRRARQLNDWTAFANSLGHRELQRLEQRGIHYRIPPPGAM